MRPLFFSNIQAIAGTSSDEVVVTISEPADKAPVANAGENIVVEDKNKLKRDALSIPENFCQLFLERVAPEIFSNDSTFFIQQHCGWYGIDII